MLSLKCHIPAISVLNLSCWNHIASSIAIASLCTPSMSHSDAVKNGVTAGLLTSTSQSKQHPSAGQEIPSYSAASLYGENIPRRTECGTGDGFQRRANKDDLAARETYLASLAALREAKRPATETPKEKSKRLDDLVASHVTASQVKLVPGVAVECDQRAYSRA